ncbi:MAG: alkaline phosphatase family protein [Burkholderiaceae bacterium]
MHKALPLPRSTALRTTVISAAVASALLVAYSPSYAALTGTTVRGVVAGTYFTPPVNSDTPASSTASSTVASLFQSVKVCFDANDNGVCDAGEASTLTKNDGSFLLSSRTPGPIIAEISATSTNAGHPVTQRLVFRAPLDQVQEATVNPLVPANIAVTPLSTEVVRMMEADNIGYHTAKTNLADRLGVTTDQVLSDPNKLADGPAKTALLTESVILGNRFALAAKMVDRHDVSPAALAADPNATGPAITIKEAQQAAMNVEGIPRYDHVFIIMLENKATSSIRNSAFAPKINGYLNSGNQFTSYYATGNPSEPNYTALGGGDDFGIADDSQWNCDATGPNAVKDLPVPSNTQPGLAKSPFAATCTQTAAVNHNITGRPNLFNALTSAGMTWRTYNESMNPGQDMRTDSVADAAVIAPDHVYAPGTLAGNTTTIGNPSLNLPLPAGLYKTKHHPGMAFQNVRSAVEFKTSNRTLGGGQWDPVLSNSTDYAIPVGYNYDQFSTDLQNGDVGNLNFVIPDQCDDMHGISVTGKIGTTTVTASDCSSVANNVPVATGGNIIARGDNYVDYLVQKIEASPIWQNPRKRVAIVMMFDEGAATSGFNSCCGWNPANSTVAKPLMQNPDGTFSVDSSINNYTKGNRGHGQSVFGVLTNQSAAPKGVVDSDVYSHFSFVRTLQDMFQLADPANDGSYMNRTKYTEKFIAANILSLPEYAGSADTHFDSVRPMNHGFVIPAGYTQKQSTDRTTPPQTGPDANQINVWSLK